MQLKARIPNSIFSLSLDGKELKVYILLSALNYAAGGYVQLSEAFISEHTDLSKASVKRALATLKEKGYVLCAKTYIDGVRKSNRYKVAADTTLKRGYFLLDLSLLQNMCGEKLLVYMCLLKHANAAKKAYISERALALETGLSRTTVRKYTSELEADGEIQKEERLYCKHKETNAKRCFAYTIITDGEAEPAAPLNISEADETTPNCYISAECFISAFCLHLERILPLRVPP